MRLLIGIVLGAALTVGSAYIYDSTTTQGDPTTSTSIQRPMVNWDVVSDKWHALTVNTRALWARITANIDPDRATQSEPRG